MFECEKCGKVWFHPVGECVYCGAKLTERPEGKPEVVASTKVMVDSPSSRAPYFLVLVSDGTDKQFAISDAEPRKGEPFGTREPAGSFECVGVIGSGKMGLGIALLLVQYGFRVVLKTRDAKKGPQIRQGLSVLLSRNCDPAKIDEHLRRLSITDAYGGLKECGLVIECVSENPEVKREVLREASLSCAGIISSNTSSIPVRSIAAPGARQRTLGLHFFNPVMKMKLVEVVQTPDTDLSCVQKVKKFCHQIHKQPVIVADSPGFIVNRLLLLQLEEARRMVREGIATPEDIDKAVRLGLNHPMGPFQLISLIGEDVVDDIGRIIRSQKEAAIPAAQPPNRKKEASDSRGTTA